jgi:hypothetical protein
VNYGLHFQVKLPRTHRVDKKESLLVVLIVEEKPKKFSVNNRDEAFHVSNLEWTCKIGKGK